MKRKVTIADVAEHCHVSKSSVSRYLNDGYVSKEHREKIRKAIQELGFERDVLASRLKAKHTKLVGVIVSDMRKAGLEEMLAGIRRKGDALGYQVTIAMGEGSESWEKESMQMLLAQGAEGVILLDCENPAHLQTLVQKRHTKVVFAHHVCTYAPYLAMNETNAGAKMGSYCLHKNAYRFLWLETDAHVGKQRRSGFASAYGAAPLDMHVITMKDQSMNDIMKEIVTGDYDVILCDDREWTMRLYRYCQEAHIHIPQNMSLACFHDDPWYEHAYPAVSALSYHYGAFSENLMEEMIAIIEGRAPQWQEVTYEMMERESVRSY